MRLDGAPMHTGELYENRDMDPGRMQAGDREVRIDGGVDEMNTPEDGNCAFYAVHRLYCTWAQKYPASWVVMKERLDAWIAQHMSGNEEERDSETPLPVYNEGEFTTSQEKLQIKKWRDICALQLELEWDRYDVRAVEGNEHANGGDVTAALGWLHDNTDNQTLKANVKIAIRDALGWDMIPSLKDSVDNVNVRKTSMVTMVKRQQMWTWGIELDALAEVLGICIVSWISHHRLPPGVWRQANRLRICGPKTDDVAIVALQYMSSGLIPAFNLIKYPDHYTYQEVNAKPSNDRLDVYSLPLYGAAAPAVQRPADQPVGGELETALPPEPLALLGGGGGGGRKKKGGGGNADGGGGGGGGGGRTVENKAANLSEFEQFFTVRDLPKFKEIKCAAIQGDLSVAEWDYAQKKLKEAHQHFFEHWSSRINYGRILLMTDSGATRTLQQEEVLTVHEGAVKKTKLEAKAAPKAVKELKGATNNTLSTQANAAAERWANENEDKIKYHKEMKALYDRLEAERKALKQDKRGAVKGFKHVLLVLHKLFLQKKIANDAQLANLWVSLWRWWKRTFNYTGFFKTLKKKGAVATFNEQERLNKLSPLAGAILFGKGSTEGSSSKLGTEVGYLLKFMEKADEEFAKLGISLPGELDDNPPDELCLPILLQALFDEDEGKTPTYPCPKPPDPQ